LDADFLNYRVIDFAVKNFEWDGGSHDTKALILDYFTIVDPDMSQDMTEDEFFTWQNELSEALYFAADDAVQWLNESNLAPDGCYWTVDDNSLYLEESNEDV
jgi:hypothetical protein